MEVDHALVIEMLPEKPRARITAWEGYEGSIVAHGFVHSLCSERRGFMVNASGPAKRRFA